MHVVINVSQSLKRVSNFLFKFVQKITFSVVRCLFVDLYLENKKKMATSKYRPVLGHLPRSRQPPSCGNFPQLWYHRKANGIHSLTCVKQTQIQTVCIWFHLLMNRFKYLTQQEKLSSAVCDVTTRLAAEETTIMLRSI